MSIPSLVLFAGSSVLLATSHSVVADESCPRTIGADRVFAEPWPQAKTWFGSESLAVMLPKDGVWPTTVPGHLIAVKLFWYSKEFQAVADQGFGSGSHLGFNARIKRLDSGPADAEISGPNWAGQGGLGDNWTILTGVDFQSAGCWEITGEYRDQSLSFVVETIEHNKWLNQRELIE